jgi:hypothetical protein
MVKSCGFKSKGKEEKFKMWNDESEIKLKDLFMCSSSKKERTF